MTLSQLFLTRLGSWLLLHRAEHGDMQIIHSMTQVTPARLLSAGTSFRRLSNPHGLIDKFAAHKQNPAIWLLGLCLMTAS